MADVPVRVLVAAFQDENGASNQLTKLKELQKQGVIQIEDAAVLHKDSNGKLHIKETADMGGGKGAVIGGVIGGVIGIIAGPPGVALGAAAGAAVGGLAAKMVDAGFPDERLREIGEGLKPNSSAIVAVVAEVWVLEAERQMREAGAKTITAALSADIAKQLGEGKEVAYEAVAAGDAVGVTRVAAGGDSAELSNVTATPEGVFMAEAMKKGDDVKVAAAAITAEGAVLVEGEGKVQPASTTPAVEAKASDSAPASTTEAKPAEAKPAEAAPPASAEKKPDAPAS